ADTEAFARFEHRRGAEGLLVRDVDEGVIADAVAHRVVQRYRTLALCLASGIFLRESGDLRVAAVDELRRGEEFAQRSSFIKRRAPANSALAGSARPSTTEK